MASKLLIWFTSILKVCWSYYKGQLKYLILFFIQLFQILLYKLINSIVGMSIMQMSMGSGALGTVLGVKDYYKSQISMYSLVYNGIL